MKIVLDTNVVIDLLANRLPFADDAEAVFDVIGQGGVSAAITANTVTDIAYIMRKYLSRGNLKTALLGIMELCDVLEVNHENCIGAFDLSMPDYEDALLAHCTKKWQADYIVTRNLKDFRESPVPALVPGDFLRLIESE